MPKVLKLILRKISKKHLGQNYVWGNERSRTEKERGVQYCHKLDGEKILGVRKKSAKLLKDLVQGKIPRNIIKIQQS
jgi:hypothetical protein